MDWEIIIHNNDNKYIEVVTSGVADADGSMNMAKSITETMKLNRTTKALIDHRNITGVSGEAFDIYDRPKLFRIIGVMLGIKIAEVINPNYSEHFKFLETVCLNRGYKFSVFFNRDSALEWLLVK